MAVGLLCRWAWTNHLRHRVCWAEKVFNPCDLFKDPKGPCTQIVDTLAPKYPNRDYFKAKVYTIWVHGPLGRAFGERGSQDVELGVIPVLCAKAAPCNLNHRTLNKSRSYNSKYEPSTETPGGSKGMQLLLILIATYNSGKT